MARGKKNKIKEKRYTNGDRCVYPLGNGWRGEKKVPIKRNERNDIVLLFCCAAFGKPRIGCCRFGNKMTVKTTEKTCNERAEHWSGFSLLLKPSQVVHKQKEKKMKSKIICVFWKWCNLNHFCSSPSIILLYFTHLPSSLLATQKPI